MFGMSESFGYKDKSASLHKIWHCCCFPPGLHTSGKKNKLVHLSVSALMVRCESGEIVLFGEF